MLHHPGPVLLSLVGVLILAALHIAAGSLHRGAPARPLWLSAASGVAVAYVFVHLLPHLAHTQAEWLEARPDRSLQWLERQVYVMALLGVLVALAVQRMTSGAHDRRWTYRTHLVAFALYNFLIGVFAPAITSVIPLVLAVIAFGAHIVGNDHALHAQYGRAYAHTGRWVLAGSILLGWGVAVMGRPSAVVTGALLGLLSGAMIMNVIRDEIPEARSRRLAMFAISAIAYMVILLALTYAQHEARTASLGV